MDEEEEAQQNNTDNQNPSALQALVNGALSSSLEKLTSQSRAIPAGKDFHFYNNFDKFRSPNRDFYQKSRELLQGIGSSSLLFGKHPGLPEDHDDAYDWLVNVNDDLAERFGIAMDEFFSSRKVVEASGGRSEMEDGGFQVVCGKNKKMKNGRESVTGSIEAVKSDVKVASRDQRTDMARTKVPFHLSNIARPQDVYSIRVNNSNQQFDHVWLERSEDGSRFIHPLEKLSVNDFIDRGMGENIPVKPLSLEETPFKFVEEVKGLKELAFKLRDVNEFAVDLEHNQYRTFQGLTCLMQISTRTEDFLIDTLKLRVHVGPYLREVFKDPSKRKVMHGADSDIVWLQRDFGIYVCNLFDTGQASRVLNLERNSLAHLLDHYCNVTANKEYQNAEWRLRPLPHEMIKYAREDTHYLLYIYDVMRLELLSVSSDSENDSAITEVYRRSYDICMNLYEKELLTDTSYLYIYGLREADFNSQQLAVVAVFVDAVTLIGSLTIYVIVLGSLFSPIRVQVINLDHSEENGDYFPNIRSDIRDIERTSEFMNSEMSPPEGLYSWRDTVARAEDESTGYILPNRALLEIARQMPITVRMLRKLVKSKNPILKQYLGSIVTVVRKYMQNASAFESVAEELKRERLERISEQNNPTVPDEAVSQTIEDPGEGMPQIVKMDIAISPPTEKSEEVCLAATAKLEVRVTEYGSKAPLPVHLEGERCVSTYSLQSNSSIAPCETHMTTVTEHVGSENGLSSVLPKVNVASIEVLKKPSGAFGALLGNSKKKSSTGLKNRSSDQEMAVGKVEQIKSSVSLPFHSFSGSESTHEKIDDINLLILEDPKPKLEDTDVRILDYQTEEIIHLENELHDPQMEVETSDDSLDQAGKDLADGSADLGAEEEKEPVSLAELSRSFQKCLDTVNQSKRLAGGARSRQHPNSHDDSIQFKPFDYEAARREMNFMGSREEEAGVEGDDGTVKKFKRPPRKNKQAKGQVRQEPISDFQMPRRRQVFPPSGNRSGTFR